MRQVLASLALTLAVASWGTGALAQGRGGPQISGPGACVATKIELRIGTGGDDLRGGQNNLNVGIEFAGHSIPAESVQNVNKGANWPNNSVHTVVIPLAHRVSVGQIEAIRLYHSANGSFNANGAVAGPAGLAAGIKTQDNWDMSFVEAVAMGNGWDVRIANHGAYRFTGTNPDLLIRTSFNPATASTCPSVPGGGSGSGGPNFEQPGSGQSGPGSGAASGSAEGGRPLTNSDVMRMVKDGVPQAAILGSIRSHRGAYDLSNKAKSAFFAAGGRGRTSEMTEIWDGMTNLMIAQETNGRGGEDTSPPNPELLSSAAGSASGNSQLLQRPAGGSSSSRSSGSANRSLQPPMPRDSVNTGSGSGSPKPLTNADVVNMLKAGVPEQAILASIRSDPAAFEVSTPAKSEFFRELRKPPAGATTPAWRKELDNTWNAMAAKAAEPTGTDAPTAGASGINGGNKNADELSPQPYPPKSKSNSGAANALPGKQFVLPTNLKIVTVGEARNPEALRLLGNASLLKGSGGGDVGPEKTMSATGNSPGPASSSLAAKRAPNGPTAIPPSGSSNQRGMLSNTTVACLNKTSVGAVNGQSRYVQFTPGGHYVITGCGFGSTPGQIYLSGGFHGVIHPGQIPLSPYVPFGATPGWSGHWSDREIDAELDPSLSGELDQDTVTLVVATSTGQQAQVTDFSFHAQRVEFMLPSIPDSSVPNPPDGAGHGWCGAWLKNCTVEVVRDYTHATPTPDYYTVKLKEGFVLSRVVLLVGRPQGGVAHWTTPNINGNQIVVNWAWNTDPGTNFTNSLYGLQIFVVGPSGVTNAWTGQ